MNITGKNFDLTPALKQYVEEKIGVVYNHFDNIQHVDVELDKNQHHNKGNVFHARVNVDVPHELIHAEALLEDEYAAIDEIAAEAVRQLEKYKTQYEAKKRRARKTRRDWKSIIPFMNKD